MSRISIDSSDIPARLMRHNPWAGAILFLVAFLLWLLNRPYHGLWHDAYVYGVISAQWIYPDALASDLFFRFGSQGSLTIFTPIYGELVRALGLNNAAQLVVLSGGVLWTTGLFLLARAMLSNASGDTIAMRFALLFGVILSFSYSPNRGIFVLNENFATARSWAMPLGLMAVALQLYGRWLTATGLALLSFLLHPLLGIWPLVLIVADRISLSRLLPLVILPALVVLFIGSQGGLDFPRLHLISGALLTYVKNANDILFKPEGSRLPLHILPLLILLLASRIGSPSLHPMYKRLVLIAVGALMLALIASYQYPVEIVVQGQPWRVTWLTYPISALAILDILQTLHRKSPVRIAVPWLCAVLLALTTLGVVAMPWALVGLGALALAISFLPTIWFTAVAHVLQGWRNAAWATVIVLWLLAVPGLWLDLQMGGARFIIPWWHGMVPLHGLIAGELWLFPLLLAIGLGFVPKTRPVAVTLFLVLSVLVLITITHWDRREGFQQREESTWLNRAVPPHPFTQHVRAGETVAWPEQALSVWFDLHTPNYWGVVQGIGAVFSEQKFTEWSRRRELVNQSPRRRSLCADPALDWVIVSRTDSDDSAVAVADTWALYSCRAR